MDKLIFILFAVGLSFYIVTKKGAEKLPAFFIGILFFPNAVKIIDIGFTLTFTRFIVIVLLITTIAENRKLVLSFRQLPVYKPLLWLLGSFLIIGILDDRLSPFLKIYRPILYFTENFLVLFLTYAQIRKADDVLKVYRSISICLLVFCLYGISNYLTKNSEYYTYIVKVYGGRNIVMEDNMSNYKQRFRVASFTWQAIYYGFLLFMGILMNVFSLYFFRQGKPKRYFNIILLFLLVINIILANSRTPIISLVVSTAILFLFAFNLKNKFRIAISGLLLTLFAYSIISDKIDKMVSDSIGIFDSQKEVEGSSISMRTGQLIASIAIFNKSPITGNGFSYITEGLGFSSNAESRKSDESFFGFESYSYELLIEQGLVGILGNIIFFLSLIIFFYKSASRGPYISRKLGVLNMSMLVGFLLFIFGTGALGSFTFFMSVIGINIKLAQILSKTEINKYQTL